MPTYDYECSACGHSFEHFQSMSSRKRRKCPECAKPKLIRLMGSGSGVIFKGSGFYETDYKRSPAPPSESGSESKGSSDSKSSTSDSGSSDTGSSDAKSSGSKSSDSSSSGSKSSSDD